jgi:hypothetical protein
VGKCPLHSAIKGTMPDLLVVSLLILGPLGIWLLMRFLNKPGSGASEHKPSTPPKG